MNVVMTGSAEFVEVRGSTEEATFDAKHLTAILKLARQSIRELTEIEQNTLARGSPKTAFLFVVTAFMRLGDVGPR